MEFTSSSSEPADLTRENFDDIIFGDQFTWIVDDVSSVRVTLYRSLEGAKIIPKPINSASLVLIPRTGQLHMKVFHPSEWIGVGIRRKAIEGKWKTAGAVAGLVKSLPEAERPKQIIATRRGMVDPLRIKLGDFQDIVVRGSELEWPLLALLGMSTSLGIG